MNETEQLRKEVNELRERVAVLESQRPKPAPAPPGPLASGLGMGILGEAARQRQQQEAERHRDKFADWNKPPPAQLRADQLRCAAGQAAQGLSADGHLGLIAGVLNRHMPDLGGMSATNPACGCGSPFSAPQGDNKA